MTDPMAARVAVNPQVLHESIDGEVMVIDLTTGSYYSLRGSAAEVWQLIDHFPGSSATELTTVFTDGNESARTDIESLIARFVDQLLDEGLLVVHANGAGSHLSVPPSSEGARLPTFDPPVLEKYTDMQDLVLLDPVHEVAETGWPKQPDSVAENRGS